MTKNTEGRERLTEMVTFVVTPSQRARLQKIADERVNGVYAYPLRWALDRWLDQEAPVSEAERKTLAAEWLASKGSTKGDN